MEFWTYYRVLRRRYRIILLGIGVAVAVGLGAVLPHLFEYTASVTLTTSPPDESQYLLVLNADRAVPAPPDDGTLVMDLARSRTLAERVIQQLGLSLSPWELRSRVGASKQGNLITLSVRDKNRASAVLLANTYADAAVAYVQEVNRHAITLARQYVEQQVEDTRQRLAQSENDMNAFKQAHGIIALQPQIDAEAARMTDLLNQQRAESVNEKELAARIEDIRARLRALSPTNTSLELATNPVSQKMRTDLVTLEVQLATAQQIYTEAHPTVVALKQQIAALNAGLARETQRVVAAEFVQINPIYEGLVRTLIDLETQRVALQAREAALAAIVPLEQKQLPGLNNVERQYADMNRERQILESSYINLETKLNDLRIQEETPTNRTLLSVVDPATSAQGPAPLQVLGRLGLAGILGAVAGMGFAFFQHQIDDTLKTARDGERLLGLPVLASVPRHNPPFEEAYRVLKTALGLHAPNGEAKALMFTSPAPGTGVSTIVYHLAKTIAQGGKRVVVVDADLRRPSVRRLFGATGEHDLMDALVGGIPASEALCACAIDNVRVLPVGNWPTVEIADLFGSPTMMQLLNDLRPHADAILIDAPPLLPFAESRALAAIVDGVILVIAAGLPPRGLEIETKRLLDRAHAPLLGMVVNKVSAEYDDSYYLHDKYTRRPIKPPTFPTVAVSLTLIALLGMAVGVFLKSNPFLPQQIAQDIHAFFATMARSL